MMDMERQLERLADSINDTARMTRTTLSLVLLVALYLGLTLVFSTDENFVRNDPVVLPQIGVRVLLMQSYIFAPIIFLYFHMQVLFLLTTLRRKIENFDEILKEIAYTQERRQEYWNWLSAFAFVQLFRQNAPASGLLARVLVLLSIEVIPLVLLFVVDLSFVRYQSLPITIEHHVIFVVDFVAIKWFNANVLNASMLRQEYASVLKHDYSRVERLPRLLEWAAKTWFNVKMTLELERLRIAGSPLLFGGWNVFVAIMFVFLALLPAWPPGYNMNTIRSDQINLWNLRSGDSQRIGGLCEKWRFACRHIDVSDEWLFSDAWALDRLPQWLVDIEGGEPGMRSIRPLVMEELDLSDRTLKFARFPRVYLDGANLRRAKLQGADLQDAWLRGAHLPSAELQGADLSRAKLQRADLGGANLEEATLAGANLQGADLGEARLWGVNLSEAKLQGANLRGAQLQGANLEGAQLQGAHLAGAQLQGANLRNARLECAYFERENASSRDAGMRMRQASDGRGPSLRGKARLDGADLGGAQLQGAVGTPRFGEVVEVVWWTPETLFDFPDSVTDSPPDSEAETGEIYPEWMDGDSLWKRLATCKKDKNSRDDLRSTLLESMATDWPRWRRWTKEFACGKAPDARVIRPDARVIGRGFRRMADRNARMTLRRWGHDWGAEIWGAESEDILLSDMKSSSEEVAEIRRLLIAERAGGECGGLRALSSDEWVDWAAGLACDNKESALSTLKRYRISAKRKFVSPELFEIREYLMQAREGRTCDGLRNLEARRWGDWVSGVCRETPSWWRCRGRALLSDEQNEQVDRADNPACGDEESARSELQTRRASADRKFVDPELFKIRANLMEARGDENCDGLHKLPLDEWEDWVSGVCRETPSWWRCRGQ